MENQLSLLLHNISADLFRIDLALFRPIIRYPIPATVNIINLKKKHTIDILFIIRLFRLVASSKYDVIISKISGVNTYILLVCWLLRKKNCIVEIRNSGDRQLPAYRVMKLFARFFRFQFTLVTNSKKAAVEARNHLPATIAIFTITNGVDISRFKPRPVRKESFHIGYAGRIIPHKNIQLIISAIALFKEQYGNNNITLTLSGPTNDFQYLKEIKTLISNNNLNHSVFIKPVTDTIERFYNSIDLFILPSLFEGTPNVLLEAMASGCICLCSKGANSDSFLKDEFIFDEHSPHELCEKIHHIHTLSVEMRHRIETENREYICNNHSSIKMVEAHCSLWNKITSKNVTV